MAEKRLSSGEQASLIREEKAKALQGLFNNCFAPLPIMDAPAELHGIANANGAANERSPEDKSLEDKSLEDKSLEDKSLEDKSLEDKSLEDKSLEDKSLEDKSLEDKSLEDKSLEDKSLEDKSLEDKSLENRSFSKPQYCGILVQAAREINFAALGVLALLAEEFPTGYGHVNFVRLAEACNVSRSTLTTQVHLLERKGLIKLGPPKITGRDLKIFPLLGQNGKKQE